MYLQPIMENIMSTDVKTKPKRSKNPLPFALKPKIWFNTNFGKKMCVGDFIKGYKEIQSQRDRFTTTYSFENTKLEILDGQCTMRFKDGNSWSDNFYFTNFAWSKLGMFFPRYFCGFVRDSITKLNNPDTLIEELYWNICEDRNFRDDKIVFRLENNVDGKNIIRSVVSKSFTELDDDILLKKMEEDVLLQDKYILKARISDTYSNIRIGNTTPKNFELRKPIGMVEFSNADSGGKSLKARSGMFTGHCLNGACDIKGSGIKKWYHTGDKDRMTDNICEVYNFLMSNTGRMISNYKKAQQIPITISDNFLIFQGRGKNRKVITSDKIGFGNSDLACKSFIEQSTPNSVKPKGKNIKSLVNSITTWKSSKMITEEPTLARCIDALTLHAQEYTMEECVDLEDYATLLLNNNVHRKEIVIDPTPNLVVL